MGVIDTALSFQGVPYVWGGTTPDGFDCSGLMQYSFAQNGISIPRTSQQQYTFTTNSRITNVTDLRAGDLVFFKGSQGTNTSPGHVGLYLGNNKFLEAPRTGDVVKISDLSSRSDFLGGGRVEGASNGWTPTNYNTTTTGGSNADLNFFGKIVSFIVLVFLGVVAVVLFAKAFDVPTSKGDLIKKVIPKDENENKASSVIKSIDDDITQIVDLVV